MKKTIHRAGHSGPVCQEPIVPPEDDGGCLDCKRVALSREILRLWPGWQISWDPGDGRNYMIQRGSEQVSISGATVADVIAEAKHAREEWRLKRIASAVALLLKDRP